MIQQCISCLESSRPYKPGVDTVMPDGTFIPLLKMNDLLVMLLIGGGNGIKIFFRSFLIRNPKLIHRNTSDLAISFIIHNHFTAGFTQYHPHFIEGQFHIILTHWGQKPLEWLLRK